MDTYTLDEPSTAVRRSIARSSGVRGAPGATNPSCPTATRRPSTFPAMPVPISSWTSAGKLSATLRLRASARIAGAYGCTESCSTDAASRTTWSEDAGPNVSTAMTWGRAEVTVPVLSSSSTLTRARVSSGPPPLTMIPCFAARETPAMMAAGAARMSGQGVATTRTASARMGLPPAIQATAASATVKPRKPRAYRSARRTNGALDCSAAVTRRMMPA